VISLSLSHKQREPAYRDEYGICSLVAKISPTTCRAAFYFSDDLYKSAGYRITSLAVWSSGMSAVIIFSSCRD
jgi:hypothetical protein